MTLLIVENGIVKNKEVDGVPIRTMICPYVTGYNRIGIPMYKVKGPTIHDTANTRQGANAIMHAKYVANVERYKTGWQASYHLAVDDQMGVQILPFNEIGLHAGDGLYGTGNAHTIGIEICINRDGDIRKAEDNAARLAAAIMNTYKVDAIYKHQDHSGKYCPGKMLREGRWYDFVKLVRKYKDGMTTSDSGEVYQDRYYRVQIGAFRVYANAKVLLRELKEKGYGAFIVRQDGYFKVQAGAFKIEKNAKALEKALHMDGFQAFITEPSKQKPPKVDMLVEVQANVLNVRSGPGVSYLIVDRVRRKEVYTIIDKRGDWGQLKSGRGWVHLGYVKEV